jgi:1,4-alpha-glucan branching enzyme
MASRTPARSATSSTTKRDPVQDGIDRLVRGVLADPHRLLGLHGEGRSRTVRAYRPDAVAMRLLVGDSEPEPMRQVHDAGVFQVALDAALFGSDGVYQLEAEFADGTTHAFEDPYRFWPSLGDLDIHLAAEGRHHHLWRAMGCHLRVHQGVAGASFAVWAPNARAVRVVGDFNLWDGRVHPMRAIGGSGIWELFIPGVAAGQRYKFEVLTAGGHLVLKADPFAFEAELAPGTASVVTESSYEWQDAEWLEARATRDHHQSPMSVYEVHLGSWRHKPEDRDRPLTYLELADELPDYVADLGFTHVELMPVAEHPFGGSWGYQVTSYFAPTSRFGSPDDFRALVDAFHQRGIGVIVDWVPAHFPKDAWALARFDGTALYEHDDPRKGEHPDWGTLVFNFGRNEVRNFLVSNAMYWIEELHIDGLRVDAVASMLYLDYSRKDGEWVPNQFGGRENLEAVSFLKEFNEVVYSNHPGVMTIAEESTAWPAVSKPTFLGGLGFGFKWNMGWMHDTLDYFAKDPVHRRFHHDRLTFGLVYAWQENFVLPLSHDEVVHGKGSLLTKTPVDRWQQHANLRSLLAWMWAHPGKQLLFMGGELAQDREWSHDRSLDWHLLELDSHRGTQNLVRELNRVYREHAAMWERDFSADGFRWIDASDTDNNVLSFLRTTADGAAAVACVANLAPVPRHDYRIGLPSAGRWAELVNTDAPEFGGAGVGNGGAVVADAHPWHGLPFSAPMDLPPMGVLWLAPG